MCDGGGFSQFMNTWSEMARGSTKPSIPPVWCRKLLMARDPPRITCNHREYEHVPDTIEGTITSREHDMVLRSFFFGPSQIAAIRRLVPPHLQHCTTFDIITAYFWRCRTKALEIEADEDVRMMVTVNALQSLILLYLLVTMAMLLHTLQQLPLQGGFVKIHLDMQ